MARRRRATYKEPAVKKEMAEIKCAFCHGTGRDPFGILSPLSSCGVCGGKGVVRVAKPYVTCRACEGTGIQPFTRLTCLACGGKGVISVAEKTETCPVCGSAGADTENRYCLRCHGSGVVPAKEPVVAKET